jgi:hypothetical protein
MILSTFCTCYLWLHKVYGDVCGYVGGCLENEKVGHMLYKLVTYGGSQPRHSTGRGQRRELSDSRRNAQSHMVVLYEEKICQRL